jgi:succinate dehydrogenase / fumarate reductase, flavoprotein subunit
MENMNRTIVSNVLVIGSGAAGQRAAIAVHEAGFDVIVVGKRSRKDAHTVLAAGGINAALGSVDPEDSWEAHFLDTFQEGYRLPDPRMVEILAQESPRAIQELADWGCRFNRTEDGKIDQRYFGAHRYRRTCYAGDFTGREILYTLDRRASQLGIPVHEGQYVSHLLVEAGVCFGALAFDAESGERTVYYADAVVLAAGGHTRIWRRSTSRRDENTGDGMYLALQAGCSLIDMEFVQFHPTGMVSPEEWAGTLVTEAVRGEGGRLFNKDNERFMERYDPEHMELSTRDRVALAIYTEIMEGRHGPNGGVFLDISHRERDFIRAKIPRIYRQFLEAQMLDISQHPMEVAPSAHYSMGGVVVDPGTGATGVEGLYAVGEVTGGLHGANRLGGNSLAETVVFGRRVGSAAAEHSSTIHRQLRSPVTVSAANDDLDSMIQEGDELPRPLQRELRDSLWELCGVVRSEERLLRGLEKVGELSSRASKLDLQPGSENYRDLWVALDLRSSLAVAEATLRAALERKESRGAHQRQDFPETDEAFTLNITVRQDQEGSFSVQTRPVPPVLESLARRLEDSSELDLKGRLLE